MAYIHSMNVMIHTQLMDVMTYANLTIPRVVMTRVNTANKAKHHDLPVAPKANSHDMNWQKPSVELFVNELPPPMAL